MAPPSLSDSRWAPHNQRNYVRPTPRQLAAPSPVSTIAPDDLSKAERLITRLSWKSEMLLVSSNRVESFAEADKGPAKIMLKLDFYEYYSLLERVLVLCLSICDITVEKGTTNMIIGDRFAGDETAKQQVRQQRLVSSHRYHANVLDSFQQDSNPLKSHLGSGTVYRFLQRAKSLRNEWKDAEELNDNAQESDRGEDVFWNPSELSTMLATIIESLRACLPVLKSRLDDLKAEPKTTSPRGATRQTLVTLNEDDALMEDAPWEVVAMEID